ncbi:thiol:disulfide interchange protein DsbE [Alishewanella longhuensis]
MRKTLFYVPLVLFLGLSLFLLSGLFSDPRERDAVMVGKPLPAFSLPDLYEPGASLVTGNTQG